MKRHSTGAGCDVGYLPAAMFPGLFWIKDPKTQADELHLIVGGLLGPDCAYSLLHGFEWDEMKDARLDHDLLFRWTPVVLHGSCEASPFYVGEGDVLPPNAEKLAASFNLPHARTRFRHTYYHFPGEEHLYVTVDGAHPDYPHGVLTVKFGQEGVRFESGGVRKGRAMTWTELAAWIDSKPPEETPA